MKTTSIRAKALACALLATTACCGLTAAPAQAQTAPAAPVRQSIDDNGVDLFHGGVTLEAPALTVGQGRQGLTFAKTVRGAGSTDNLSASLYQVGSTMYLSLGPVSDSFTVSGSTYTPTEGNGATLTFSSTTNLYTYTTADGTVVRFDKNKENKVLDVARPSGEKLVYSYDSLYYCTSYKDGANGPICLTHGYAYRLGSVRNSFGYRIVYDYDSGYVHDPDDPFADLTDWRTPTGVTGGNLAAPGATMPSQSFAETTTNNVTTLTVTDAMSRTTKLRYGAGGVVGVTRAGNSSEDVTYAYASGRVSAVTTPAGTTSYSASDSNGVRTVTVANPLSQTTTYTFDIASARMKSATDPLSRTTAYQHDSSGRVTRVTGPEGNYVQYSYDARGNVTEVRAVAKAGSGLADIVASSSFDSSCSNAKTCNQPNSTTDARGNTTDYTYDSNHGGVLTVTAPAPTTGAVRPKTTFGYTSLQAYFSNGSAIVASGEPVTLPASTSTCQTLSSCAGTADEVKTIVSYGPQTNGTGNNLLPVSTSAGNGSGTLTATTAMSYDSVGNVVTVDGPLAGTADTMKFRYNAGRERIGTVSPDPDGAGALKHRAQKVTIDGHGLVTKVETGTVDSQSDSDWAGFSALEAAETAYDSAWRPVTSKLVAGGTTHALSQISYDAAGRVECTAQRMNPAEFASPPASACTLDTAGSFGPDRIVKTIYDAAGEVTQVKTALGTADEANEVTSTYRSNGQVETVKDAENNLTTYEYDGHDRLAKTRFPSLAKGAGTSSTTDYEQPGYDSAGNVTSFRNRANETTSFTFDKLNRLTLKDLPGSEPDVSHTYDLIGRMTGASYSGHALTFTYDALSRPLTQAGPQGTITSAYDLAGRRTRITHPDGFYVDQEYLVTGELEKIRENGANSGVALLATFAYDNRGRRTSLTRGNGAVTSYTFDAVSRLATLVENPAGTTHDLTLGFTYSPASQIVQNTRSNDLFAWISHTTGTINSTANGLNQLATHAGATITHDTKGNLTFDGTKTFAYSSENLLKSVTNPGTGYAVYDPLMRLYEVQGWSGPKLAYDGVDLVLELSPSTGAVVRRYVHGPGVDEPLVWYEGSGTTDRRFLHADERGSMIAVSNGAGSVTNVNTYDEYGKPASGNVGRFQYTGQKWISDIGLYDYKARMYHPTLPRFLQPDPIGYGDGLNMYAGMGGDPVNMADPTGMWCTGSILNIECKNSVNTVHCLGNCGSPERWYGVGKPRLEYDLSGLLDDDTVTYTIPRIQFAQDTAMTRAMDRDAQAVLDGKMTQEEFNARNRARMGGVALGTVGLAAGMGGSQAVALTRISVHGGARLAGANATRGGVLSYIEVLATRFFPSARYTASNGANVYVRAVEGGTKFNVSLWGNRGFMTSYRHLSAKTLARISRSGGWE